MVPVASVTPVGGVPIPVADDSATVTIVDNYRATSDPLMLVQSASVYESDAPVWDEGRVQRAR